MRQLMLAAAVSGAALIAGFAPANAQLAIEVPGAGVYVGPTYYDNYYDDRYYEPYGPRVYGYSRYDRGYDVRARERYSDRQRCGRNAYWDGQACIAGFRP